MASSSPPSRPLPLTLSPHSSETGLSAREGLGGPQPPGAHERGPTESAGWVPPRSLEGFRGKREMEMKEQEQRGARGGRGAELTQAWALGRRWLSSAGRRPGSAPRAGAPASDFPGGGFCLFCRRRRSCGCRGRGRGRRELLSLGGRRARSLEAHGSGRGAPRGSPQPPGARIQPRRLGPGTLRPGAQQTPRRRRFGGCAARAGRRGGQGRARLPSARPASPPGGGSLGGRRRHQAHRSPSRAEPEPLPPPPRAAPGLPPRVPARVWGRRAGGERLGEGARTGVGAEDRTLSREGMLQASVLAGVELQNPPVNPLRHVML
ncbi:uncharacterized protein LOC105866453 [Microcebus murinus]|uniref:uncharacterized protein LOC105866453 n=1 Tax=Microcebus murinus TaxID=30608 RepID=UPI003F6CF7BA